MHIYSISLSLTTLYCTIFIILLREVEIKCEDGKEREGELEREGEGEREKEGERALY